MSNNQNSKDGPEQKREINISNDSKASSGPSTEEESTRRGHRQGRDERFGRVWQAIKQHENELRQIEGFRRARPGYEIREGWLTEKDDPIIVVEVGRKIGQNDAGKAKPVESLDGIPVQVRFKPPKPRMQADVLADAQADAAEDAPSTSEDDLAYPGHYEENDDVELDAQPELKVQDDNAGLFPYKPPVGASLAEVTGAMTVKCHVSPDAGWATLKEFLESMSDKTDLTIGMYDFTAPHILETLDSIMSGASGDLKLILDPGESLGGGVKSDDVPEADVIKQLSHLDGRFKFVWAAVGHDKVTQPIFPSAYHIKVAVNKGKTFWLSSGNWQSSNQPDLENLDHMTSRKIQRSFNREWHVVMESQPLANTYKRFLEGDIAQATPLQVEGDSVSAQPPPAPLNILVPETVLNGLESDIPETKFFKPRTFTFTDTNPLRVQPLLTPDNYADLVLSLISTAEQRLYFQNQYIHVSKKMPPKFAELIDTILEKVKDGVEVKIILRDIGDTSGMLEALRYYGFKDMSIFQVQVGCHTKGIIVDSKAVVLGSHNWSGDGVLRNRDASLIFYNEDIAKYYEEVFLYDWKNLARQKLLAEEADTIITGAEENVLVGIPDQPKMILLPWDVHED